MRNPFKAIARLALIRAGLYPVHQLRQQYLSATGWNRSVEEKASVDRDGRPVPWITYPALEFLAGRVTREMAVFEYGSGGSTLWWASRVATVVSCEHDRAWYEKIDAIRPTNVTLRHVELERGGAYSREVAASRDAYDVIVIDGRDRVACAKNCLGALRKGGVVLWDNTDRPEYQEGFDFLTAHGFKRLDFNGTGPMNPYGWCTSIFYRVDNCFGI